MRDIRIKLLLLLLLQGKACLLQEKKTATKTHPLLASFLSLLAPAFDFEALFCIVPASLPCHSLIPDDLKKTLIFTITEVCTTNTGESLVNFWLGLPISSLTLTDAPDVERQRKS